MKNRYFLIGLTAIIFLYFFLSLPGCSTSEPTEEFQQFELNVTLGEGVTGTPVQGTYPFNEGDTVDYSYELLNNYKNLSVTLNNDQVEASGTITITGVHTLKVLADAIYDITGSWNFSEEYDDGSIFDVMATFSGALESGTISDSDGGEGVYTVDEYNTVEFNLEFDNINYEYEGRFDSASTMSGTCKKVSASGTSFGYWSATRIEETSSISRSRSGKKVPKGKKKR